MTHPARSVLSPLSEDLFLRHLDRYYAAGRVDAAAVEDGPDRPAAYAELVAAGLLAPSRARPGAFVLGWRAGCLGHFI